MLLYLEEHYKQVDKRSATLTPSQRRSRWFIDVFDTRLRKSMNVEPVELNLREGSRPYACYSCRPTPAHYR